ncbi:hypothetical protein D3OALGA1CA_5732 [Olavius algarvensis associated proteobacterium Delta 3]|nr:hypothetical protein D3OALGB2SA_2442 [Olavius algarvensis associated proteobacterium Delta 3]CAB5170991.1 hypothetical protein D3OALGA1CA_5732 [Olavius algarvensis associated proteobacterium Delta 3]
MAYRQLRMIPCAGCLKPVEAEDAYRHRDRQWCADCAMKSRTPRVRKTHWQYLKSIKSDYLRRPDR